MSSPPQATAPAARSAATAREARALRALDGVAHQSAPAKIRPDGSGLTPLVTFPVDAHNHAAGVAFPWTADGVWVVGLLVRGDAGAQTTGIWAVAGDGSGCLVVPIPAAQSSSADAVGSVR